MMSLLRPAIVIFLALSTVTGVAYPLVITGVARTLFSDQANGSLIVNADGRTVGSSLVGQEFSAGDPSDAAKWFWGRPSATGPLPYTALNLSTATGSSGSNLAPSNPTLLANVQARIDALRAADAAVGFHRGDSKVPVDLVTASGSGLDPHISPAAAEYQAARVAKARRIPESTVLELVRAHTTARTLGVLGEPVVNVLELNLDLQARRSMKP